MSLYEGAQNSEEVVGGTTKIKYVSETECRDGIQDIWIEKK